MGNEEYELEERLRQIKAQKESKQREEENKNLIDIIKNLLPIAKARLFKEKIGLVPHDLPLDEKRSMVEGYIALGMFEQAAIITEYDLCDYERAMGLYLTEKRKEVVLANVYSASDLAKNRLHDTQRAIDILVSHGKVGDAVDRAEKWGEIKLALEIAEKYGEFWRAKNLALKLGQREKGDFYRKVGMIEQNLQR